MFGSVIVAVSVNWKIGIGVTEAKNCMKGSGTQGSHGIAFGVKECFILLVIFNQGLYHHIFEYLIKGVD